MKMMMMAVFALLTVGRTSFAAGCKDPDVSPRFNNLHDYNAAIKEDENTIWYEEKYLKIARARMWPLPDTEDMERKEVSLACWREDLADLQRQRLSLFGPK